MRAQGLTLPDFILVSPEFRWKGAGGVVAAGLLGNDWQIDERALPTSSAISRATMLDEDSMSIVVLREGERDSEQRQNVKGLL